MANLLLDSEIAEKAIVKEVIFPATRVLRDGTRSGKIHAARAISRLLHSREVDYAVNDCVNRVRTVLALVSSLDSSINESVSTIEALEALAMLSRSEETGANVKPACAIIVATIRALKLHGGEPVVTAGKPLDHAYLNENVALVEVGCVNLARHVINSKLYGANVIVVINKFSTDTDAELNAVRKAALDVGAYDAVVCSHHTLVAKE